MVKDLKIRAYVNCTKHEDYLFVFLFALNFSIKICFSEYKAMIRENIFALQSTMFSMLKTLPNFYVTPFISFVRLKIEFERTESWFS